MLAFLLQTGAASERLNVGRSNLAIRYTLQKSPEFEGQGHQEQKCIEQCALLLGRTQQAATDDTIAWPFRADGLRRWENQRMLSSILCTSN